MSNDDALSGAEPVCVKIFVLLVELVVAEGGAPRLTMPKRDSSGVCSVASAGFNVHGRMYTQRTRAFSSGDKVARGTLA